MFALHHALATALSCLALAGANAAQTSSLWGKNGELYDRTRLPDFSYAGYAAGEADIPNLRPTMNIQDYGAVGDGKTDDTTAILQAVRSAKDGDVIYFPPGRYILKQKLIIAKRVSLKGAGSDQVSFVFPKSLGDIYGGYKQTPTGNTYSSNNGFIQYAGDKPHGSKTLIGSITQPAARGTNVIKVSSVRGLKTGQWVSVTMGSPRTAKDFLEMNLNVDRGCADRLCRNDALAFTFQSRIAEIVDANTIELERPLPYDLIMDYSPLSLYVFKPKLANIGVEGFTFEFQSTQYIGHYYEKGWNGIQFNSVSNSWIKDIVFINADIGINIFTSFFITVQSITHQSTRERLSSGGQSGHHGINLKQTSDCLVQFFEIDTRMVHDLTVDKFARGSVFSQGSGQDLNMDHHKAQNYGSLWVQLNSGSGARAYASGGASGRGPAAGSLTTFWNLQAAAPQSLGLKSDFGPYLNFIAVHKGTVWPRTSKWTVTWLLEDMLPSDITPVNIFQAMRQKRLSTDNLVSDLLGGKGTGGMPLISL